LALASLNFQIEFLLKKISIGITGDKDDILVGNQTLLEFGLENQLIRLSKEDFICKGSVFGFTFKTYNCFELLLMFAQKLKKFSQLHSDNLAIQNSYEHYKKFIQNTKHRAERQKEKERL
jgi:hypothetical protein